MVLVNSVRVCSRGGKDAKWPFLGEAGLEMLLSCVFPHWIKVSFRPGSKLLGGFLR